MAFKMYRFLIKRGDLMKKYIVLLILCMCFILPMTVFANNAENEGSYQVLYYANGGEGLLNDNKVYNLGDKAIVLDSTFTRKGHSFIEWNTEADGSGTAYSAESIINMVSDVQLYAQWKKNMYKVSISTTNGGGVTKTTSTQPVDGKYEYGTTITLTGNPVTGWALRGWYKDHNFDDSSCVSTSNPYRFIVTEDITLTGSFRIANPCTINVTSSGGGVVSGGGVCAYGSSTTLRAYPLEGYKFVAWYENGVLVSRNATVATYVDSKETTYTAVFEDAGLDTGWKHSTDSGYYLNEKGEKVGVIRFLFDLNIEGNITESGIRYVKSIGVNDRVYVDAISAGNARTFYGDLIGIPEEKA